VDNSLPLIDNSERWLFAYEQFMLFYCYLINWAQHATTHFNQQSQAATGLFMDILDVKTPEENERKLSTGDCRITSIFIMKKEP
jgi:hypothetical protein